MPWVRFAADFDFSPAARGGRVTVAYRAGMTKSVTRECAEKAVAAGRAVKVSRERKEDVNGEDDRRR